MRFRCYMQTISGIYAQYEGHVDVWSQSDDHEQLHFLAVKQLRRTAFPDYTSDMWRLIRAERLP